MHDIEETRELQMKQDVQQNYDQRPSEAKYLQKPLKNTATPITSDEKDTPIKRVHKWRCHLGIGF